MDRKDKVIEYIHTHPSCSRTNVIDNMPFADKTTKKVLKELIEEDKVTCLIDKTNPRIHHLILNYDNESERINRMLESTSARLTTGETAYWLHRFNLPIIMHDTVFKTIKNLLANGERWEPYQSK